jgi:Ca-activated chloride channel homolog
MFNRIRHGVFLLILLVIINHPAAGQVMSIPSSGFGDIGAGGNLGGPASIGALSSEQMTNNLWYLTGRQGEHSPLDSPAGSVSMLDLKAPGKARREFAKGYQLLMRKEFNNAIPHLTTAISQYPDYVAAHNALGSAYLGMGKNDLAREQFAKSVSLDDHVPTSYLNLGCAQLALQDYPGAEQSVQKASALAPVDLVVATALSYAQFMNRDYDGVLATARQVHSRKHPGAAMVHYFAAAAWDGQNHLEEAQSELQTLLQEDPKSPAAEQARNLLLQLKAEQIKREALKNRSAAPVPAAPSQPVETGPTPEQAAAQAAVQAQMELQDSREQEQIAEAEAEPEPVCAACASAPSAVGAATPRPRRAGQVSASKGRNTPFTVRTVVDEVAVFFAATDHGKSVTDLTREDIGIRDDEKSPAVITGFRTQAQLPLRLGIVIDTSESIASRFSFEQKAATDFLQKVLTDKNDQAFVVGVANSVLLVQDFTNDQAQMTRAIHQLAPAGGTALWDAVAFAADKLAVRKEDQPVARILVVISDGKDNSSSATLKETIASAERGEVFVYTVSTREASEGNDLSVANDAAVGDRALKVLAENTGGAAFVPGSIRGLNKGLDDLQEVIHSRYLISYKPALFKHDGRYRAIDISAKRSGRKLRVYARKGYYAGTNSPDEPRESQE